MTELEQRYRKVKDAVERSHYQIIWLLASGRSSPVVPQITSYSLSWIYQLVWAYNRIGLESLRDKRHKHRGGKRLLNDRQQAQLSQVLHIGTQKWLKKWGESQTEKYDFILWSTMKGGEYFFAPSISFIKNIGLT